MQDKATITDTLSVRYDLTAEKPQMKSASGSDAKAILFQIEQLRTKLTKIAVHATDRDGRSPIDRAYDDWWEQWVGKRLAKNEKNSVSGAKSLSWKLRIEPTTKLNTRNYNILGLSLFALFRLSIAEVVQKKLESFKVSFADVLAMYRSEGDLSVPLSYNSCILYGLLLPRKENVDWPLSPDDIPWTNHFIDNFLSVNHTFDIDKLDRPNLKNVDDKNSFEAYWQSIRSSIDTLYKLRASKPKNAVSAGFFSVMEWFQEAKEAAFVLYMLLIGGLDFYTYLANDLGFAYNYARNRKSANRSVDFLQAFQQGRDVYRDVTNVTPTLSSNSLIAILDKRSHHHIVPLFPIEFVSTIITEAMVRIEAFRREQLICGSQEFDPPLPTSVAYIRYNGWDIYFVVLVLEVLYVILVKHPKMKSRVKSENPSIQRLRESLAKFDKDRNEVWTILKKWREAEKRYEKDPNSDTGYFLFDNRNRVLIKKALAQDAISVAKDDVRLPGTQEKLLISELNAKGLMNTAVPIIDALTKTPKVEPVKGRPVSQGWYDFEKVMVAHIGKNGKSIIADPMTISYGREVGQNVLKFYCLNEGYKTAFPGF